MVNALPGDVVRCTRKDNSSLLHQRPMYSSAALKFIRNGEVFTVVATCKNVGTDWCMVINDSSLGWLEDYEIEVMIRA